MQIEQSTGKLLIRPQAYWQLRFEIFLVTGLARFSKSCWGNSLCFLTLFFVSKTSLNCCSSTESTTRLNIQWDWAPWNECTFLETKLILLRKKVKKKRIPYWRDFVLGFFLRWQVVFLHRKRACTVIITAVIQILSGTVVVQVPVHVSCNARQSDFHAILVATHTGLPSECVLSPGVSMWLLV